MVKIEIKLDMIAISKRLVFAIAVLSTQLAHSEFPKPAFPACDFYEKAENEVKCSKEGCSYLKEYGFYYCNQFNDQSKNWSPEAKRWVDDTGLCLQEMIYDNRTKRIKPCTQMEEFAFDAHPICYRQYGVCSLSFSDKVKILRVVRAVDTLTRRSLVQVLNVLLSCLFERDGSAESATYKRLIVGSQKLSVEDRRKAGQIFLIYPEVQPVREQYFRRALGILLFGDANRSKGVDFYLQSIERNPRVNLSHQQFDKCMQEFGKGRETADCRMMIYGSTQKQNIEALKGYKSDISSAQIEKIYSMGQLK